MSYVALKIDGVEMSYPDNVAVALASGLIEAMGYEQIRAVMMALSRAKIADVETAAQWAWASGLSGEGETE